MQPCMQINTTKWLVCLWYLLRMLMAQRANAYFSNNMCLLLKHHMLISQRINACFSVENQ